MRRRRSGGVILATLLAPAFQPALACGFEDPSSASVQRGLLNLAFPKALHVTTAVWQAQLSGSVPKVRLDPQGAGSLGFRIAAMHLRRFGQQVDVAAGDRAVPAFTVVIVGPMLWANYARGPDRVEAILHAKGPVPGDVVLVTDEVVIMALLDGSLGPREAWNLGLIRSYGDPADIALLEDILDDLQPLENDLSPPADAPAKRPKLLSDTAARQTVPLFGQDTPVE